MRKWLTCEVSELDTEERALASGDTRSIDKTHGRFVLLVFAGWVVGLTVLGLLFVGFPR